MLDPWIGKAEQYGTHRFILDVILIIALSIGWVGFVELKRGGHRKILLVLKVSLIILLFITFFLIFAHNRLHWKMTWLNFEDVYLFIPFYALLVAIFPLALYLNRNQKKSTP
jgi:cell division protein FtsW (lipid II flippase)